MATIRSRVIGPFAAGVVTCVIAVTAFVGVRAAADPGANEATFVPITPCRLFDTRPAPDTVGQRKAPIAADETFTQQVTGTIGDCTISSEATAVAMNVTALNATAPSFLQLWPADAAQPERGSSLNYLPGQPPTPNKVDVKLSPTGAVNIYNLAGSVDVIGDVVGYYTNQGIQDIVDDLATKADAAAVYTKTEADAAFVATGKIVTNVSTSNLFFRFKPTNVTPYAAGNQVSGDGSILIGLTGPEQLGGIDYGLESVEFCLYGVSGASITLAEVYGMGHFIPLGADSTGRDTNGCYSVDVDTSGYAAYDLFLVLGGGASSSLRMGGVRATWAPAASLANSPDSVGERAPAAVNDVAG